jgi:hypothetical protein
VTAGQYQPSPSTGTVDAVLARAAAAATELRGEFVWEYENPRYTVRKDTPKESGAGIAIEPWWVFRAVRYEPSDFAVAQLG